MIALGTVIPFQRFVSSWPKSARRRARRRALRSRRPALCVERGVVFCLRWLSRARAAHCQANNWRARGGCASRCDVDQGAGATASGWASSGARGAEAHLGTAVAAGASAAVFPVDGKPESTKQQTGAEDDLFSPMLFLSDFWQSAVSDRATFGQKVVDLPAARPLFG